jgi:translocation and assembly module TamA
VVELKEGKTKRVSLGLGYSTDTGVRGEASYRQTLLFGYPYTLNSGVSLDKTRGVVFADVYLPPKPDGEQDNVGALLERTDNQGLRTNRWAVGAQRTYSRISDRATYDTTLAVNFQRERTEVESDPAASKANDVVSGTYSWTRRDVDSLTSPTRGTLLTLSGTLGVRRSGLSNLISQTFERGYGRYVYYWPLSPRDQLILRAEAGHVIVDDVSIVPNEFLFRTGGVGTVRGYAYQSLGSKVGTSTTGSKSLIVGSAEYVRWVTPDWGAAFFFDAGNAADDIRSVALARGYGIGVRYRTVAGALALDLAYGEQVHAPRLHFSIAIAF